MPCNSLQPQLTKDLCRPSEEGKKKKNSVCIFSPVLFLLTLSHLVNMWSERWHTWNLWTLLWTAQSGRMRHFRSPAPCRDSQCFLWSQTWAARPISAPEVGAFHFVRQCTRTPPTPPPPCDSVSEWVLSEWMRINRHSCSAPFPALHG